MSFKRILTPESWPKGQQLTRDLIAIGFRLAGHPSREEPNIENTLFAAIEEAFKTDDYRTLSLFVDWIEIHGRMVNVDRVTRLVISSADAKPLKFWSAIAQWQSKDPRWKKLARRIPKSHRFEALETGTDFLISKHGEDPRFKGTVLRIPANTLRHRPDDILPPSDLAAKHSAYQYRLVIGPTYRADMWGLLERNPDLSPAELARLTYGSFSSAWGVKRDFELVSKAKSGLKKRAV